MMAPLASRKSNLRWCSDGFTIPCDNGERVEVAFALDCCDREAIDWIGTSGSIAGEHIRDRMLASIEKRFNGKSPERAVQWLSDNGSVYAASDTRKFAKLIGLNPGRTPVRSPQSNGMAESFVKTFKRDYVAVYGAPDALTVLRNLPRWFEHYNEFHPHKALGYRSPREFRRSKLRETA